MFLKCYKYISVYSIKNSKYMNTSCMTSYNYYSFTRCMSNSFLAISSWMFVKCACVKVLYLWMPASRKTNDSDVVDCNIGPLFVLDMRASFVDRQKEKYTIHESVFSESEKCSACWTPLDNYNGKIALLKRYKLCIQKNIGQMYCVLLVLKLCLELGLWKPEFLEKSYWQPEAKFYFI